jgi:hypothetical protein
MCAERFSKVCVLLVQQHVSTSGSSHTPVLLCFFLMRSLLLLLLCPLLQGLRPHPSHSTPDILPSPGDNTWTRKWAQQQQQ